MNALISVIVPIYKVEQYLNRCIESLVSQTYSNIEIILVDDGSPDRCPIICDEWAKRDNRIIAVHKENGGLSDARNTGIAIAKGDYLAFVDSDDYVKKDYLSILHSTIVEEDADIAICNFFYSLTSGSVIESGIDMQSRSYLPREFVYLSIHSNFGYDYAWNKLYRRELFNQVHYKLGKLYEDVFAITDLMEISKKVVITDEYLYYYTERDDSICGESRGRFSSKIFDLYEGWNYRCISYMKMGWKEEAVYAANRGYNSFLEVIKECYCDNKLDEENCIRIKKILEAFDKLKLVDYKTAYHANFGNSIAAWIHSEPQRLIMYKKIRNLLERMHLIEE